MPEPLPTSAATDALELEIFRAAVSSITDELELNLTRTALSELIYEYKDFSIGLLTRDFKLLAQSEGGIPLFVADLGVQVLDAVEVIGVGNLEEGDIFVSNFGPANGQHLNNITFATPIFQEGGIVGYVAIRAHWTDIGGLAPGSMSWDARSIFQEGVQYRGLRVVRAGVVVPEILATLQANTRLPHYVYGDAMAQIQACRLGLERWRTRVARKWTVDQQNQLIAAQAVQSAQLTRSAVGRVPDGEYVGSCFTDDAGAPDSDPLELKVTVVVEGERVVIDFSGMPAQVAAPINMGRDGGAMSLARCACKLLFAPDQPVDEWLFDPLEVNLPDGTVISATGDAPMSYWNTFTATVVDLILKAVGDKAPEMVPAGHHASLGMCCWAGRDDAGRMWVLPESAVGGFGGHSADRGYGPLRTLCHGDNRSFPIELLEARYPLRVLDYKLWREASGEGLYPGGYGTERRVEVLDDVTLQTSLDRTKEPPWGMNGGQAAQPGSIKVKRPGNDEWLSVTKVSGLQLPAGSIVHQRHAGGGGWGAPAHSQRPDGVEEPVA